VSKSIRKFTLKFYRYLKKIFREK